MEPLVIDPQKLGEPQTWRPSEETAALLEKLSRRTRMPKAEITRRAVAIVLPKFLSGELMLVDATETASDAPEQEVAR